MSETAQPNPEMATPAAVTETKMPTATVAEIEAALLEQKMERASRPVFAWPIYLAILTPLTFAGFLAWGLSNQHYIWSLRITWISLCSFIPALALMGLIGSVAQIKRRPILSVFSMILCAATMAGCWWAVQYISANAQNWIR
jgi:hypothetical protein